MNNCSKDRRIRTMTVCNVSPRETVSADVHMCISEISCRKCRDVHPINRLVDEREAAEAAEAAGDSLQVSVYLSYLPVAAADTWLPAATVVVRRCVS